MFGNTTAFSSFSVNDIGAAKDFYQDTLGLEVESMSEGLNLTLPGGGRAFLYLKPDHQPATFTVLNFLVGDIDRAVASLRSAGIKLERYDMPSIPQDEDGIFRGSQHDHGPDIAWFKDPAGNILSVLVDNAK